MSHRRRIITLLAIAICAAGCADGADEALPPVETAEVTTTASDTTAATATTSTTEATTTSSTLSELEQAETEIRDVVTGWWQLEFDTSKGEADLRLEALTGLLYQRVDEANTRFDQDGVIHRTSQPSPIEITELTVDLDAGTAEVDACTGSVDEFLDAETLEVLGADDPEDTSTSLFQLQVVEGQWKINEWISSGVDGDPISCELES